MMEPVSLIPLTKTEKCRWADGLFDCSKDLPGFVVALFCFPCMSLMQLVSLQSRAPKWQDLLRLALLPCFLADVRREIRLKWDIDGSFPVDFVAVLLCGPCAIAQQTRFLKQKHVFPSGSPMTMSCTPPCSPDLP
eukprot:TRINITY_DN7418_c0_g1_i1.p1 TRINITY_DN7418_c0_g1~~TRINITY_DN7418_c0_g1_i1.p1  ORF type:complete len:135 (-),score=11.58 TRINITY_DN7418_c0_g1_i1:56-460(-)